MLDKIIEELATKHFSIVDNYFDASLITALRNGMLALYNDDHFHKAAVGKGADQTIISEVRGDNIFWLNPEESAESVKRYFSLINELRIEFKRAFFLPLNDFEAHFAFYPKNSFYLKHYDQFRGSNNRLISVVLYLNTKWEEEDNGKLRIYLPSNKDEFLDFAPLPGRLAIFRSDTVLHEVLPTTVPRYSLTGWMRSNPPDTPIYKLV
jgi:SM-20-related protein